MPELPEVETVRRGLAPVMVNGLIRQVELRRADLRFPLPERFRERLEGRRVASLDRRAKYLLARLDSAETLIMHLGMSGSFRVEDGEGAAVPGDYYHARSKAAAHDHVVFRFAGGASVVYNDPRRFGFMDLAPAGANDILPGLGPEPLDPLFDAASLARSLAGKAAPLKSALLDQKIVAGLGNIYVCEALHRARLAPERLAGTLATGTGRPTAGAERLEQAIEEVLGEAIAAGGSSISDHVLADGSLGMFQHRFRVYDREGEPCPREGCGGHIGRRVQAGRSTFYCDRCQR